MDYTTHYTFILSYTRVSVGHWIYSNIVDIYSIGYMPRRKLPKVSCQKQKGRDFRIFNQHLQSKQQRIIQWRKKLLDVSHLAKLPKQHPNDAIKSFISGEQQ